MIPWSKAPKINFGNVMDAFPVPETLALFDHLSTMQKDLRDQEDAAIMKWLGAKDENDAVEIIKNLQGLGYILTIERDNEQIEENFDYERLTFSMTTTIRFKWVHESNLKELKNEN